MRPYSFARLLMAKFKVINIKLALRPKYHLNFWIHGVLPIKKSYFSLFFIENVTPREIVPPENLRHCFQKVLGSARNFFQ